MSTSRSQFPDTGSITVVDYVSNASRGFSPTPYPRAHVELYERVDHGVYEYNGDSIGKYDDQVAALFFVSLSPPYPQ